MFKKLKKKVAEDPTVGLADSSGKLTKPVLSPGASAPGRPVNTASLQSDEGQESLNAPTVTSPGSAVRLLDAAPAAVSNGGDKTGLSSGEGNDSGLSQDDTVEQAGQSVCALQEQLQYLQQRLTTAEAKESAAILERDHGERQMSEFRKEIADQSSRVVEHQDKCKALSVELSSSQSALVQRDAEIVQLRRECAGLTSKLTLSETQCGQLTDSSADLATQCEALEQKSANASEQIAALNADRSQLEAAVETERQESQASRRELLTSQEHCRQLQAQLSSQQSLHAEEVNTLRERLSTIGQQFAESDHPDGSQVAALAAERDEVEKRLSDVRKQLADQQAASDEKIATLEILNQEKDSDLSRLRQKLDETESSLQSHVMMVKELQDTMKSRESQLLSVQEQSEARFASMKQKCELAEQEIQAARTELQLQQELTASGQSSNESQIDELSQQLSRAREQIAESTMKSSELVTELENQLGRLQTARELDKTTADSKLTSVRHECAELRQNLAESRRQVVRSAEERALLDADLTAAVSSIQSRNQCVVAFSRDVGHAINSDLVESSLYSDDDGKLKHSTLSMWREEVHKVLDFVTETISSRQAKCESEEERARQLVNSLELEQYSVKQLQSELSTVKASLEEATYAASKRGAAVLSPTRSSVDGGVLYGIESADASKPALMAQTSSSDAMQELAAVHQRVTQLEEEMAEKNQTVRQQQQLLADLRKQLQRQLGKPTKPSGTSPGAGVSRQQSQSHPDRDNQEKDTVNDIYLKNVILRYMCSSEAESQHLIKAVATLLGFTTAEEQLVREYYSYKVSWFGAKPAQPPS